MFFYICSSNLGNMIENILVFIIVIKIIKYVKFNKGYIKFLKRVSFLS